MLYILGNFSAAFEGVPYGRLHFRNLEHDKIRSLKKHIGNFDKICTLSSKGVADIKWWRDNIHSAVKSLNPHPEIDYIIYTDASNDGWGADDSSVTINGRWNEVERELHINVQEMLAIKLALLSFLKYNDSITHVR